MINSKSNIMIRKAERQDVPLLLKFIRGMPDQPNIDFYLSLGAVPMKEWTVYRFDTAALVRLSK